MNLFSSGGRQPPKAKLICLILLLWLSLPSLAFASPPVEDPNLVAERRQMVERHLKGRDITDPRVLEVMGRLPRHLFVDESLHRRAYGDYPLPIGEGQTISQPYIVAFMTQALNLKRGEKVLEIGTGSGYQAAVLAELGARVYTIEIRESLTRQAAARLGSLGYDRVRLKSGDGYFGWEDQAPFDAILVTCAANHIPPPLIRQLQEGGRMVLPLGSTTYFQTLNLLTKRHGKSEIQHLMGVAFVPMIGEAQKK